MLADDDLYLDDAYAFLVHQSRLQHPHHHSHHHHHSHRKHHLSASTSTTSHTPHHSSNTDLTDPHNAVTMKPAPLPAHSHIAHLHHLLQQQQQQHLGSSNTTSPDTTGMTAEEQSDAAMATAAALSLCALDNASLPKLPPRIMKILYVDAELEEKEAAAKLEEVTSVLYEQHDGSIICSFTVIANAMAAMESTEHVDYDAIFIAEGKNASFNFINKRGNSNSNANIIKGGKVESADISAYDFLRILRMVGSSVPMILLTSSHDLSYSNSIYKASSRGLPAIGFDTITDRFAAVLQRPYRSKDICHLISQIIASNTSSDSTTSTTDSMTELDDVIMRETRRANEPPAKSARTNNKTTSSGGNSSGTNKNNNNCIQSTTSIHRTTSSTSTSSVFTVMGQIGGGPFNNASNSKFNP